MDCLCWAHACIASNWVHCVVSWQWVWMCPMHCHYYNLQECPHANSWKPPWNAAHCFNGLPSTNSTLDIDSFWLLWSAFNARWPWKLRQIPIGHGRWKALFPMKVEFEMKSTCADRLSPCALCTHDKISQNAAVWDLMRGCVTSV